MEFTEKPNNHRIWAYNLSCYHHRFDSFFRFLFLPLSLFFSFFAVVVVFTVGMVESKDSNRPLIRYSEVVTFLILLLRAFGWYTSWSHLFLLFYLDRISYYFWRILHTYLAVALHPMIWIRKHFFAILFSASKHFTLHVVDFIRW